MSTVPAGIFPNVPACSFRTQFLFSCVDVVGEELLAQAPEPKSATELAVYGRVLFERARAHALQHGCAEVEHQRTLPGNADDIDENPARRAHVVFAAAKWCLFWAELGHGLDPG